MEYTHQLSRRFREVILNGTWIANTNFKDQLINLDWQIATISYKSLNAIAVLAQHIHYYIVVINAVFGGGALEIRDQFSFDFKPIESQDEWDTFLSQFWTDAERFAYFLEQMPDQKLNEAFNDEKYGSFWRNIDGMIEHSYYHLGQIVLLKKILTENK